MASGKDLLPPSIPQAIQGRPTRSGRNKLAPVRVPTGTSALDSPANPNVEWHPMSRRLFRPFTISGALSASDSGARASGARRDTALLAFLITVALSTGAVLAHAKGNEGDWFYANNTKCVRGLPEIADGNYDNGFARATTESVIRNNEGACPHDFLSHIDKQAGSIAAAWEYDRWNGQHTVLQFCTWSDYLFNDKETWNKTVYWDFHHPPCDHGDYVVRSGTWVKGAGTWIGGPAQSPEHHF
jgi:hypothetical protein